MSRWLFALMTLLVSPVIMAAQLTVRDAYVPEAPPVATVMAGYMHLENPGDKPLRIKSVSSPQFDAVQIHQTVTENGVSKMVMQNDLTIPAKGKVALERGGMHLMLMQPKIKLKAGDKVTLKFKLTSGKVVAIKAEVKPASLDEDHSQHQHHH